jgi:protein-L-isoaspartate(D-aspartate) O-methyltransferase
MSARLGLSALAVVLGGCGVGSCAPRADPARAPASAAAPDGRPDDEAGFAAARRRMVARQIERRGVRDPAVLAALRAVPRHRFVDPEDRARAYADHPLGIGHGQTISQPYIVGLMSAALALRPGDRVLEVGTGSGYQAAVLARLARDVYTIEIVPALAERAARLLRELEVANVHVRAGDGYLGWPEAAPFDAIMITAATPALAPPLIAQLAEGGRLCAPMDEGDEQVLVRFTKRHGRLVREALLPVRFVPMTGRIRAR